MKFRGLEDIIARQREDALAAALRRSRLERHGSFTAWAHRWTKTLKAVGALASTVAVAVTAISVGSTKLYHGARRVYGALTLMRARNVAPAELPVTGVASTSVDRVDKPVPPRP